MLQIAAAALERAHGNAPVFMRSGGSIPVVAEMGKRGWPTIVSGFALDDDEIHAPNESYREESVRLGEAASRELLTALASRWGIECTRGCRVWFEVDRRDGRFDRVAAPAA